MDKLKNQPRRGAANQRNLSRNAGINKSTSQQIIIMSVICCFSVQTLLATTAKIIALEGDVKVRRGIEENWQPAAVDMLLKEIDTITTGEDSEVTLQIYDNLTFRLTGNAILDIADLKKITQQELFLYLTRQKVSKLKPRKKNRPLRATNISSPHGEDKSATDEKMEADALKNAWEPEQNGAKAMFDQAYYTNAVMKLHKIATRHPGIAECSEYHYLLGAAFEALAKPGQAIDAYQAAVSKGDDKTPCQNQTWAESAKEKLKTLRD